MRIQIGVRLLVALLVLLSFGATAHARDGNFAQAWPPEPYLSQAIASINAGRAPWIVVRQRTIDREWNCARGALGCTADGGLGLFIMISVEANNATRCIVLIHEEAHRLGWAGNHQGGTWAPNSCPLSGAIRANLRAAEAYF